MTGKRKKKINISINPEMPQPEVNDTDVRQDNPEKLSCHTLCESLLSYGSGFNNFQGIFNWSVVLLVWTVIRPCQDNFSFPERPYKWPAVYLIAASVLFALPAVFIERYLRKVRGSESIGLVLQSLNLFLLVTFPAVMVYRMQAITPAGGLLTMFVYIIIALKLFSYYQVNRWYREGTPRPVRGTSRIQDVTPFVSSRFLNPSVQKERKRTVKADHVPNEPESKRSVLLPASPTLCYQLNFPRQKHCRQGYIIRRFIEMIFTEDAAQDVCVAVELEDEGVVMALKYKRDWRFCSDAPECGRLSRREFILQNLLLLFSLQIFLFHLMLGLIQQWIVPNIHKSMKPINEIESTLLTEYILKLAVPNHFIWLIFFYWYFHSCLNCLAELLRFGDRQFYLDWWNADSVLQFWSRWNIPAHKWLDRHIYRPLLHHGYDKWQARMTVFLLSACFYEYLIAIPLKMFRFWMFFAMAAQVPLACLMKKLFGGNFGNILVWISLVLGPPLMVLLYFHDYYIQHHRRDSSWRLFFF